MEVEIASFFIDRPWPKQETPRSGKERDLNNSRKVGRALLD